MTVEPIRWHTQWLLDDYMKEFKARVQTCDALGVDVGKDEGIVKIVAAETDPSLAWEVLVHINTNKKLKDMTKLANKQYQLMLLFWGLNKDAYGMLQAMVRNVWIMQKINVVPKMITAMVKVADKFVHLKSCKRVPTGTQPGVVFIIPRDETAWPTAGGASGTVAAPVNVASRGVINNKAGKLEASGVFPLPLR